jgi:hypothetical protein
VTSQGKDPGADLVHLQGGCDVLIEGKVESTGPGHVRPPVNRCHAPDKPANASACVEVWSGGTITVNASSNLKGEINVDTAQSGGVNCCAWIDLFAIGDIAIKGDTGGVFALHANQLNLSNSFGGWITAKSTAGNITASGLAIQAKATLGGRGVESSPSRLGASTQRRADSRRAMPTWRGFGLVTVGARVQRTSELGDLPGGVQSTGDARPTGTDPSEPEGPSSHVLWGFQQHHWLFPFSLSTNPPCCRASVLCGAGRRAMLLPDCVCAGRDPDVHRRARPS